MYKIGRIGMLFFLVLMFLFQVPIQAQSKKYFVITGKIVPEVTEAGTGVIEVTKNQTETSNIQIPKNGRFRFELEFFNEYSLNFKYPGHFNKIINVSTVIPQEVWERDNDFPPFPMIVQLLKEFEGIDKSFALKPSGRIFYGKDIDNFEKESYISDIQFLEQIATAKSQAGQVQKEAQTISKVDAQDLAAKQKDFDQLVKEADTHYQRGEYQMALMKYLEARKLFPDKAYPNDRVAELQDLVKALEITQKQKEELEAKYRAAIAKANGFFDGKSYQEARPVYEEALQYKPGDVFSNGRINEIDQLLALLEKQKQYNELIAQADNNYQSKNYEQAEALYNQAKQLVPNEQYPQNQINLINQEKQQLAQAAQLEKDFSQAMQTGETQLVQKDYLQAMNSYKKALELKPDSKLAQDKITEMEQAMVAVETDKKYQEAIQLADQALAANDLQRAKTSYQEALKIKAGETYPQAKLAEISSSEANEIQFTNLVATAEEAIALTNYDESINALNQALAIKPQNASVKNRINEVENLKKQQVARQEYEDLIAQADQAFGEDRLDASLAAYQKALQLKNSEQHPQKQVQLITAYQAAIKKADSSFGSKDYAGSLSSYNEALAVKPNDRYASGKIGEIRQIEEEQKKLAEQAQAQLTAYQSAMAAGDKAFADNDFNAASSGYQAALNIKPNDPVAKEKFGQSEAKLAQLARMSQAYNAAIAEANRQLTDKKYPEAKEKYQEALQYDQTAEYPKRQIVEIDKLLAQQKAEIKLRQDFDAALAEAENLYNNKELAKAKDAFMRAYNLIPSEPVPPRRISEIDGLLAQQAQKDADLAATLEAYKNAIQRADRHFGNKEYGSAQLVYNEALLIKGDEQYPVDQLALVEKLMKEQIEQNYKAAIAQADNAFNANRFDDATKAYRDALALKKDDPYATRKLQEIDQKKADIEAENNRLKKLEADYAALIAAADTDFRNKEYQPSRGKYQQSLTLKPAETYPKEQIAKIDQLLTEQQRAEATNRDYEQFLKAAQEAYDQNQLKEARALYQKGYNLKPFEPLPPMRIAQIDAMLAQQAEAAQLAAMEEAQRLAKEKADREQYNNAVAAGDKAFNDKKYKIARVHYTDALIALANEKYPRDQIAKIDELLAQEEIEKSLAMQKAQQDSLQNAKNRLFDLAMTTAKAHDENARYTEAIQKYNEAIGIKPEQRPAVQKLISDIEEKMQLLARQDADYKRFIKLADDFYAVSKLNEALADYKNAAAIKPNEAHPKSRIQEITSLLAAREQSYANAIKNGDGAFNASDWQLAKTAYTEALGIKPDEKYPADRLKLVNQKIADANLAAIANSAENQAYREAIEKAEKAFQENQLTNARMQFEVAKTLKPAEKLPVERIKEIDLLIDQRNKERLAQAQRELDEKYRQAISVADNSFREKTYAISKLQYQQALLIKPEESYPKSQMALIDKLMSEAQPVETYVSNLPVIEPPKPAPKPLFDPAETAQATEARAKSYVTTDDYDEAVKKADQMFGIKDYSVARFYYFKANEVRPNEAYPKNQLDLIRKLIDSQLSSGDVSAYDQALALADAAFAQKNYTIAKFHYYKALEIKSWEKYPKDRINEILALTNSLLSEREEQEYRDAIAKADEAYFNKDIAISRFYYNRALAIKKDENYPRIKLKDIQKLIEQDQLDQQNLEYRKIIELADQALQMENFSIARFNYNKALTMRPDEKYPKDQLKRIREALEKSN